MNSWLEQKHIFHKFISLLIAALMVMYPTPLVAGITYANEETPPAESAPAASESLASPDDSQGGSSSSCSSQTPCPGDNDVNVDNQAATNVDTAATATTGTNDQTGEDTSATTGDAGAGAGNQTDANTTDINLEPAISATSSSELENSSEATASAGISGTITIDNTADVTASTSAQASTGANNQTASNDTDLTTGNATASATSINVVNTNLINSQFQLLWLEVSGDGDIDLYQTWYDLLNSDSEVFILPSGVTASWLTINADNTATVSASTTANASTGGNSQTSGGEAQSTTGNATAIATNLSFINTNIIKSTILGVIVNINGAFTGNLILPNFMDILGKLTNQNPQSMDINVNNVSNVSSTTTANSSTGNNSQASDTNTQTTGNSISVATNMLMVNSTAVNSYLYQVIVNNSGNWLGSILGLFGPLGNQTPEIGANTIGNQGSGTDTENQTAGELNVNINNTANVSLETTATATTGNNNQTAGGNANLKTGNAFSAATTAGFINSTFINTNILLSIVNILGQWTGDLIMAHPDLTIDLSTPNDQVRPGEPLTYTATVTNIGHAHAHNVTVENDFPRSLVLQADSIPPTQSNGVDRSWSLGDLAPGESISFTVSTIVDPAITPETNAITYAMEVLGTETEDMSNNADSETDQVVFETEELDSNPAADPLFRITPKNNVNEFVNPGDSVRFDIAVDNLGEGRSENTKLNAVLLNASSQIVGGGQVPLKTINAKERIKVNFTLPTKKTDPGGLHRLIVLVSGTNTDGKLITSDTATSQFLVKKAVAKNMSTNPLVPQAQASDDEGSILGDATPPVCEQKKDLLPYILAGCLGGLWGIDRFRRRFPPSVPANYPAAQA